MARPLRFQYPGAIYHLMARGDGGKAVFETDEDRKAFLVRLRDVCLSHGWRAHAWVLMKNHFHLLVETPEPNLVAGMKWLLGTFSQVWNRARKRRGHVFQGRYKSIPVNGSEADGGYFRSVADYIHLNPARAGLVGGESEPLRSYGWSSLQAYTRTRPPEWQECGRVLRAFDLSQDGRGRRAYVAWREARAANDGGKIDGTAMKAIRRGWYLGEEGFKERLLKLVEKPARPAASGRSRSGGAIRESDGSEAERLCREGAIALGLPTDLADLAALRKGDARKVRLAALLRSSTAVSNAWIAERLAMGHPGSVSRLISQHQKDGADLKSLKTLRKMLKCED